MLGHRLRRWPNSKPPLTQCIVLAVVCNNKTDKLMELTEQITIIHINLIWVIHIQPLPASDAYYNRLTLKTRDVDLMLF